MSSQRKSKVTDVVSIMENPGSVVTIPKSSFLRKQSAARQLQERLHTEIVRRQGEIILELIDIKGQQIIEQTKANADKEITATRVKGVLEITETAVEVDNGMLACATTASRDMQDLVSNGRSCIKIATARAHQAISGVSIAAEQDPNVVEADFEVNDQKQA